MSALARVSVRLVVCAVFLLGLRCSAEGYRVLHAFPHDGDAFTQGLVFADGYLYESTGLNGHSTLRMEDVTTGQVLREKIVPPAFFAEGLTIWGDTLVQLTWKSGVAFVYDRQTFRLLKTLHYSGEGWGLTQDRQNLILSDGSADLRFLNPDTFDEVRRIHVTDHGKAVDKLNELEYVRGEIYANVWFSNRIAEISPNDGHVIGWIDLAGILPALERRDENAVLNGIAYDREHDRLFVTGKLWPTLFQISVTAGKTKH